MPFCCVFCSASFHGVQKIGVRAKPPGGLHYFFATNKRGMRGRATNDYKSYSICTSLVNKTAIHGLSISIPSQGSFFPRQQESLLPQFFGCLFVVYFAQLVFMVYRKSVCELSPLGGIWGEEKFPGLTGWGGGVLLFIFSSSGGGGDLCDSALFPMSLLFRVPPQLTFTVLIM